MQAAWLEVRRDSDFPTRHGGGAYQSGHGHRRCAAPADDRDGNPASCGRDQGAHPFDHPDRALGWWRDDQWGAIRGDDADSEQSGLPGGLVGRPLRQAVLVIRQDRAVLGDDAPWRRAGTACWRRRRPCCWPAPPWRPWRRRPPHNRLKVPSRLIDQKSYGREWPRWMPWRAGMHQRVDAVDRACQVVGLRRSAWSSSWAVSIGRKSSTLACARPRPGPVPPPGPGCRRRRLPAPSSGVAPCWSVDARVVAGQGCLTWTTPSRESRPNSSTFGL